MFGVLVVIVGIAFAILGMVSRRPKTVRRGFYAVVLGLVFVVFFAPRLDSELHPLQSATVMHMRVDSASDSAWEAFEATVTEAGGERCLADGLRLARYTSDPGEATIAFLEETDDAGYSYEALAGETLADIMATSEDDPLEAAQAARPWAVFRSEGHGEVFHGLWIINDGDGNTRLQVCQTS